MPKHRRSFHSSVAKIRSPRATPPQQTKAVEAAAQCPPGYRLGRPRLAQKLWRREAALLARAVISHLSAPRNACLHRVSGETSLRPKCCCSKAIQCAFALQSLDRLIALIGDVCYLRRYFDRYGTGLFLYGSRFVALRRRRVSAAKFHQRLVKSRRDCRSVDGAPNQSLGCERCKLSAKLVVFVHVTHRTHHANWRGRPSFPNVVKGRAETDAQTYKLKARTPTPSSS
jgi:hypothetical protein